MRLCCLKSIFFVLNIATRSKRLSCKPQQQELSYDIPLLSLYWTSGADAVLTNDKDISLIGAKAVRLEAMAEVREYARSKSHEVTLRIGGVLVVGLPVGGIVLLLKIIGAALRSFSNLPREIQLLLIGGALFAIIHPGTPRTIAAALSSLASNLELPGRVLFDVFCELSVKFGEAQLDLKAKESAVKEVIPPRTQTSLGSSIEMFSKNVFGKQPRLSNPVVTSTGTRREIPSRRSRGRKAPKKNRSPLLQLGGGKENINVAAGDGGLDEGLNSKTDAHKK